MSYVSKKDWNTVKVSLLIIVLFLVICLAGCTVDAKHCWKGDYKCSFHRH